MPHPDLDDDSSNTFQMSPQAGEFSRFPWAYLECLSHVHQSSAETQVALQLLTSWAWILLSPAGALGES